MRPVLLAAVVGLLSACDFVGGADTLVRGSNNFIGEDAGSAAVAVALAELEATPMVTDEEVAEIYAAIRARAMEGDLASAQVLLKLAAIQRMPQPEPEE